MNPLRNPNVHAFAAMAIIAIIGFKIPSFFESGSKASGDKPTPGAQIEVEAKVEAAALNEALIQSASEAMVRDRLKAPTTARFEALKVLKAEDPWYQVLSEVHAQNSFGAMIRERYVCTFKLEAEDKYSCSPRWGVQQYRDFDGRDGYEEAVSTMLEMYRDESDWGKPPGG